MADSNPFLQSTQIPGGSGSVLSPTPLFNQQGAFNPAVNKAAGQYAKQQMNAVQLYMSRRGLQDSSFLKTGLGQAFNSGFDRAISGFQQQQQVFGNLAMQQNQLQANAQALESQQPSFLQGAAAGGLSMAATGNPWAIGTGMVLGGLSTTDKGQELFGGIFG